MKRSPKTVIPPGAAPDGPDGPDGAELPDHIRDRFSSIGTSPAGLLDFLLAITDNLGEGTCALDRYGHVTFMNPAAERMLGWTEAELRGQDLHAAVHGACAAERCPLPRAIGAGQVERVEDDAFTRHDGTQLPVAYVLAPMLTGGAVSGAALSFHDITDHRALDEALRRSERDATWRANQLLAVFESMADAIVAFDRDGRITQTNAADADMLALVGPPAVAPLTLEARRALFTFRDEQDQPIAGEQAPSTRVLRGETLRGERAVDLMFHALDGRDITVNVSGAPVRDAAGAIAGGVLIRRDVTQRRRLERRTREALAALMAMAEALVSHGLAGQDPSPLGTSGVARRMAELIRAVMGCERVNIVVNDPQTGQMRAAGFAGLSPEQERRWLASWPQTGRSSDYLTPDLIARLDAGETLFIDRTQPPFDRWSNPFGSRTLLVLPMRIGDEHLGDMSLDYGAALYQPSAEELAMAGAVTRLAAQIVERERLARERELARANALALTETTRRMDEFLSIAAHELKTPVTNTMLALTLAADTTRAARATTGLAALDPAITMLERAEAHMDRLSRLVVDLLDVSRIQAGKLELRVAPLDLAALAREVVEEQRQQAPGRVIHLRLPSASGPPLLVRADPDRIRQVITNYLTNALKYSREPHRVYVSARADGAWARIAVRDEGPGAPVAERRRLWERFYRVPGTQVVSGVGVGLGLGLHIARTIIEQHDGKVGLRSAPGHGAIFWFALRLAD